MLQREDALGPELLPLVRRDLRVILVRVDRGQQMMVELVSQEGSGADHLALSRVARYQISRVARSGRRWSFIRIKRRLKLESVLQKIKLNLSLLEETVLRREKMRHQLALHSEQEEDREPSRLSGAVDQR